MRKAILFDKETGKIQRTTTDEVLWDGIIKMSNSVAKSTLVRTSTIHYPTLSYRLLVRLDGCLPARGRPAIYARRGITQRYGVPHAGTHDVLHR